MAREETKMLSLMLALCLVAGIINYFFGNESFKGLFHDTLDILPNFYLAAPRQYPALYARAFLIMVAFFSIASIAFWKTSEKLAPVTASFLGVVFAIILSGHASLDWSVMGMVPLIFGAGLVLFALHLALYYAIVIKEVDL